VPLNHTYVTVFIPGLIEKDVIIGINRFFYFGLIAIQSDHSVTAGEEPCRQNHCHQEENSKDFHFATSLSNRI